MSTKPPLRPDTSATGELPELIRQLGYGGLIPFVALGLAAWLTNAAIQAQVGLALIAYGASIASFLGAIHWGLAMRETGQPPSSSYVWGVIPSLLAWLVLLLEPAIGLVALAALLWLCFGVDRVAYTRYKLSHWLPMRLHLTVVASASCLGGAAGLFQ